MDPLTVFGSLTHHVLGAEPVAKATPTFVEWQGPPPGSTYGGKCIVDYAGRPAFAELAILWTLQAAGWDGIWVTHARGQEKHRRGFWGPQSSFDVPTSVLDVLGRVRSQRGGTSRGTWDIVFWPSHVALPTLDQLKFLESKRKGRDSISVDQIEWFRRMREEGARLDAFLIIEWTVEPVAAHLPVASRPRGG